MRELTGTGRTIGQGLDLDKKKYRFQHFALKNAGAGLKLAAKRSLSSTTIDCQRLQNICGLIFLLRVKKN